MALNIQLNQKDVIAAVEKFSFSERSKKQTIEVVDGIFANVTMYGQTLLVEMGAEGWWSRGMASLRLHYGKYSSNEEPRLNDKSFNTSAGGIEGDVTTDFTDYCNAMERRGLAHVVLVMIAETLMTDEYQERIVAAINEDYRKEKVALKRAQEKRALEREAKEKEIKLNHDKWLLEHTPLCAHNAQKKAKEITADNANKPDAFRFIVRQKVKVETFCMRSGEPETQLFEISHNDGRNAWAWYSNGTQDTPERVSAKKVTEMMVGGVVELV